MQTRRDTPLVRVPSLKAAAAGKEDVMAGPPGGSAGRRRGRDPRLPPGQYDVGADWPVLTAEPTPRITPQDWTFTVDGHVESPTTWTWDEAPRLTPSDYRGDIHCVKTWSKFDTH